LKGNGAFVCPGPDRDFPRLASEILGRILLQQIKAETLAVFVLLYLTIEASTSQGNLSLILGQFDKFAYHSFCFNLPFVGVLVNFLPIIVFFIFHFFCSNCIFFSEITPTRVLILGLS